jgi:hypothetical protein
MALRAGDGAAAPEETLVRLGLGFLSSLPLPNLHRGAQPEPGSPLAVQTFSNMLERLLVDVVGRRVDQLHRDPLTRIDRSADHRNIVMRNRTNLTFGITPSHSLA